MTATLNLQVEILKKIGDIFPYYYKNLKEDDYLKNLWRNLAELFIEFFLESDELHYFIEKNGFIYQDQLIIPPASLLNFHQVLYKDGTRVILFKKGISREELASFFSLSKIPFSKMTYKDQSLKIFIQRNNFEKIKFYFIEDEEIEKASREYFKSFFENSKDIHNEYFDLSKEKKEILIQIEEREFQISTISEPVRKSLKFVFEETIMAILSQYEKEEKMDYKVLLLQSLRYLYQEAINSADFKKINFILRNLKFKEDKNLNDLFIEFQEEETLKNLLRALPGTEILKTDEFILFYDNLMPKYKKKLINKIFEENITVHREEIYSVLSHKLENNRELLLEIYKEIDRGKIQNFLHLLQKLPEEFIKEEELLDHKNPEIKAFALKICKKLSDRNLLEFLDSENLELRIQTLSYIERFKKGTFVPILISRIKKENFYEKEREEKEKYFEVLGRIKNIESINFLKELLSEHKLFSSQKKEELRAMAAMALGQIKDPKIKELLTRESKSIANSNIVREACRKATEVIEEKERK